jgi:hypothetical protein
MSSELMFFAEQLAKLLDPKDTNDAALVQKGLTLYRQDLVYRKAESADRINATVQDVMPVQVELDLLFPQNSTCSCNPEVFCRHKLAVFFYSFASVSSISDWLRSWRATKPFEQKIAPLPIQRASELLKKNQAQLTEKSYLGWKQYINDLFKESIEAHMELPAYLIEDKIRTFLRKIESQAPLEREWKNLFAFVANFATLFLVLRLIENNTRQQGVLRILYSFADDLIEEIHNSVQHLGRQARPFAFDPFFEGIRNDVTDLISGKDGLEYEKTDVYRAIWSFLLTKSSWRKEELDLLKQRLDSGELNSEEITTHTVATIHLSLLANMEDEAEAMLQRLGADASPYMFYWLKQITDLDTDQRGVPFIEFLILHVGNYLKSLRDYYKATDFVRIFSRPVSAYCYKAKRMDLLEKFYRECLPFSYWNYANFLFEQGSYKKWVEMHIYSDISIDVISTENIKKVVAEDPALVLPLYYHAVQDTVSMKNRSAYKQAVRYLKKMRTIYKKLKKEELFTEYVAHISESTKRLRAFQEELKRGKLIDA